MQNRPKGFLLLIFLHFWKKWLFFSWDVLSALNQQETSQLCKSSSLSSGLRWPCQSAKVTGNPSKRQEGSYCMERRSPKANPPGAGHKSSFFLCKEHSFSSNVACISLLSLLLRAPVPPLSNSEASGATCLPSGFSQPFKHVVICRWHLAKATVFLSWVQETLDLAFASSAKVSITQSLNISLSQSKEKPFPSVTTNITRNICHASKSSKSVFMGFLWEISAWEMRIQGMFLYTENEDLE